jgi:Metallo-beta-lactamase superfamily.
MFQWLPTKYSCAGESQLLRIFSQKFMIDTAVNKSSFMSAATELYEFNTANWALDNSFMEQLTNPGESYPVVCPFYLVDHPQGTAVVDTGLSHDMLDDPASYGPYGAEFMEAFLPAIEYTPEMHPRAQLEDAGYSPEDVDYLVLTHLHSDHAGHIDTFPNAEIIVQESELRYAHWPVPVQEVFYLEGDFDMLRSEDIRRNPRTRRIRCLRRWESRHVPDTGPPVRPGGVSRVRDHNSGSGHRPQTVRLQWFEAKAHDFSRGMKPTPKNHTRYHCPLLSDTFRYKQSLF